MDETLVNLKRPSHDEGNRIVLLSMNVLPKDAMTSIRTETVKNFMWKMSRTKTKLFPPLTWICCYPRRREVLETGNTFGLTLKFVSVLFTAPLTVYHAFRYVRRTTRSGIYDATTIMNLRERDRCQREGWIKLAYYIVMFFYFSMGQRKKLA